MGNSIEANLKSYRNNELKWFLFANTLLMLVTSDGLQFDFQNANSFSFISEIMNITAVSSCAYILTFIFDSVIPPIIKVRLIYWNKKQPSCTIFTDMFKKVEDNRFTVSTVIEKYQDIYVKIENGPKKSDQTPYWYSIYERHRNNPIVFGSNRDYLLLRDMHTQTITLLVVYIIIILTTDLMAFSLAFLIYILFMVAVLNIGTRVQGKRVIYNTLSVDINTTEDNENLIANKKE